MKGTSYYKSLGKLVLILAIFLFLSKGSMQTAVPVLAASGVSPDAIAFRVMPNSAQMPNSAHLSPARWYQENIKVKGSPQVMTVDGYQAVRDGRTVYVDAANVAGSDFYTNIYIISYNQAAENQTIDIFNQILNHWKFNVNITDAVQKAKIVRDTKRLADLSDIQLALANYRAAHNDVYPNLSAGSYLAGKSITVWPSWQATLGAALGITMPVDPLNRLGDCSTSSGYNQDTCWNQTTKQFADPTPANNEFNLPVDSHAYIYTIKADGSYNVCATMETTYTLTNLVASAQAICVGP